MFCYFDCVHNLIATSALNRANCIDTLSDH